MNVILITVLVSTMTTLSSASSSAQIDNYIRIKNNYLMPLAKAASEAYNTSFDDVFKVMDYYGLNGGFCHADDILRIYYSLEPTIDAEGPVQVANTLYELDKILDLDVSLVKRTFDTYRLFADTKWITPDIVYECLRLSHHVDNFLGLKNFDKWLKFETQENRLYAVVMCLLEFPGLEKHDRFILETVSKYRFKDELPTNCAIFRALGNWHLLKDDKEGLNELDLEFVKLKELLEEHTGSVYHLGGPGLANIRIDDDREILEEHTGSVYHLGGSGLANIRIDDDREILKKYLEHLRSLPAPSPMSDIANRTVDRVLEKLRLEIMSIFYRELTPYPGKDLCKQPT